jgi:hypothetical protein
MDNVPSTFEWFEQNEGRGSERARKLTFLVLFQPEGQPGPWLLAVGLAAGLVGAVALGGV